MSDLFVIKQGDTSPPLQATLASPSGSPQDLTGISGIVFSMRPKASTTPTISRATALVTGVLTGEVEYQWQTNDTDVAPGSYLGEFEVTFGTGEVATYPNDTYIKIKVVADIA